jgi:hypothetical protein
MRRGRFRIGLVIMLLIGAGFGGYELYLVIGSEDAVATAIGDSTCTHSTDGDGNETTTCNVQVRLGDQEASVRSGEGVRPGDHLQVLVDRSTGHIRGSGTVRRTALIGFGVLALVFVIGAFSFIRPLRYLVQRFVPFLSTPPGGWRGSRAPATAWGAPPPVGMQAYGSPPPPVGAYVPPPQPPAPPPPQGPTYF